MPNILGLPNCGGSTSTFNSGVPLCDVIRQQPKALFLMDSGLEFTTTQAATRASLIIAMKAATRAPRGARLYPIHDLTNYEDKTKEAQRGTLGNLVVTDVILNEAVPAFSFQHHKGDLFHQQLAGAQNSNLKIMFLDSAYVVYGTKTPTGGLTGYSLSEFYAELAKFATASEPSKYPFSVTLASLTEIKENLMFAQLDSTVLAVTGNRDVTLEKISQAANVINIALTGRGGKNMGSLYPTELAAIAAFVITNAQTGAAVTVASVTYNATLGYYVVTADNTAYTALTTGQAFNVSLASASALSALNVDGFEGANTVQIVKP